MPTRSYSLNMRVSVPGIEWPPLQTGPSAELAATLTQLEHTQWMATEDIEQQQRRQLGILADFCAEYSPRFRARLEADGLNAEDLSQPGGLARLRPLQRRDLQDGAAHCAQVPQDHLPLTETRTSGSTGEPVTVRRTSIGQRDWLAMTMRDHFWHLRTFTDRMATVRAHIRTLEKAADWGAPANLLYETGPSLRVPIGTDAREMLRVLADFQPQHLIIYPSSLAALCEEIASGGPCLEGLRHLRTIGETLSEATAIQAHQLLGIRPVDAYSSQEVGYIALQCPQGTYHVMAEALIVEVVDEANDPCQPGQIGRVLITDLHNFATPLIRYDIGDYAQVSLPCACGRGLPALSRIVGRERNLVRLPDGRRHWPSVGFAKYRDVAPVRQYQLLQTGVETIEARLVVERALSPKEEEALRAVMTAALRYPFAITFHYFDGRLPVGANGKFEEFKCLIAASNQQRG